MIVTASKTTTTKAVAAMLCALLVTACGFVAMSREDVARAVLASLEAEDLDAFLAVPRNGDRVRSFDRSLVVVSHVDFDTREEIVELDPLVMRARFGDGWSVDVPVVLDDGRPRFVPSVNARHADRHAFPPEPDELPCVAALAALRAVLDDDREAFEALLADDATHLAYDTSREVFADHDAADARVVALTGTDDAVLVELHSAEAGADFVTALRRDDDGAWRLVSPIVD